nr:RNA-binding domain-containing protein [Candidatus Sigynarchaeum springense]
MNQDLRVASVRLSAHAHPTEVVDKARQALANLIPAGPALLGKAIETTIVDGDYGNKIHILGLLLKSASQVDAFLQTLKERLPDEHKQLIRQHFDSFFNPDNKTLFLRFHKQLAFQGQLRLSQYDDIVHASIKFTSYTGKATDGDERTNILKFLLEQGIIA